MRGGSLVVGLKVCFAELRVRLHGGLAGLPAGRTHLTVLVRELEGLQANISCGFEFYLVL